MLPRPLAGLLLCLGAAFAQGPVVLQRGVLNAVTLEPAPSRVAPGDILLLRGLNLGPVEGAVATAAPLPTTLGGVQAFVNNRPAAILSIGPGQIRIQVPLETPGGLHEVVVQRGELRSRPASVRVMPSVPAIRTKNDLGFGEAGATAGAQLTLPVSGLGLADDSNAPRLPVRAYVGGLPAQSKAALSATRPGEFDVIVDVPEGAQPGDIVTVTNGGAPANRSVLGAAADAAVQYLPLPAAFRDVRAIRQSDLRGNYIVANGPVTAATGCFPTWIFDLARGAASPVEPCLVAQQNALSPVTIVGESHVLASFAGPKSDQQNLVSAKVQLFNPARETSMTVELPSPAAALGSLADGSLLAIGGGTPYAIDVASGEVREVAAGAGGVGAAIPGGGGPGGGGLGGGAVQLRIDLGDGLNVILSAPMNVGQGTNVAVVGNDANKPTRAKVALLGNNGTVTGTRDFPESWIPLVPPPAPQQQLPGGGGQAQQPAGAALRLPVFFDGATRSLFVLAKKSDGSAQGFAAFGGAQLSVKELAFPAGWFAATCSPNVALFNLELSRRLALFGAKTADETVRAQCPAQGYLALDFATQEFRAVPLPGVGEVNARTASGDVNDYLFASNSDGQNVQISDTLYVYDSVAGSPFRLDLPAGIVGFQQVTPIGPLNGLIATAVASRVAGDGGLVFFDLENEKTTLFPVPEGFQTVTFLGVFPNTRKIVARGNKADGSQFLIYDLLNGNLLLPKNPDGVAYVGVLPAVPGMPGQGGGQPQQQIQGQFLSVKSNYIAAVGFDAARAPVGILAIKVP